MFEAFTHVWCNHISSFYYSEALNPLNIWGYVSGSITVMLSDSELVDWFAHKIHYFDVLWTLGPRVNGYVQYCATHQKTKQNKTYIIVFIY